MKLDVNAKYLKTHEWAKKEENLIVVGITDHAQSSLGDIVYIDLPKPGTQFNAGAVFGVVESVKAASDLYLPVSGKISAVNSSLTAAPETVNKDCYGEGWFVKVEPDNPAEFDALLNAEEYENITSSEE